MNQSLKITLIIVASLFGVAILVGGGILIGRSVMFRNSGVLSSYPDTYQVRGTMMGGGYGQFQNDKGPRADFWPGRMGSRIGNVRTDPALNCRMDWYSDSPADPEDTLSMEQSRAYFEDYLNDLGDSNLSLNEIMIFDQNAYAILTEKATGFGAMELLLAYESGGITPEFGPNRMWNLKYGMMASSRNWHGQEWLDFNPDHMDITLQEAKQLAQDYLNEAIIGAEIAEEGTTFYGYYTFDYVVAGEMAGMLSVNGLNGQVWPHTWHGQFIEEWEAEESE